MAQAPRKTTNFKDLAQARSEINKQFPGAAVSLEPGAFQKVQVVKTGAILVDLATGVGGLPRGRLTEIYGVQSSGKSSLIAKAAGECQAAGGFVVYFDYEHAFEPDHARMLGLNTSSECFQLYQPEDLETGFEICRQLLENSMADMIVFDSLAAMITAEELATKFGDKKIALTAKGMAEGLRKLVGIIHRCNAAVIFINHVGEQIGGAPSFGPPKKITPGGRALKFYSSLRIELVAIAAARGKARDLVTGDYEDVNVAVKIQAQMVKNKLAAPFKRGTFYMRHGRGISRHMTAIEIGIARGFVQKRGARIVLPAFSEHEAQNLTSFEAAVQWLEKNDPDENLVKLINANFINILREEMAAAPTVAPAEAELDDEEDEEAMLSQAARDAASVESEKLVEATIAAPPETDKDTVLAGAFGIAESDESKNTTPSEALRTMGFA